MAKAGRESGRLLPAVASPTSTANDRPAGELAGRVRGLMQDEREAPLRNQPRDRDEAVFRTAFTSWPHGMAIVSLDSGMLGRFLEVNDALCAITGRSRAQLLASGFPTVAHEEDRERYDEFLRRSVAGASRPAELDARLIRADGTVAWTHLDLSVVRNDKDSVLGLAEFHDTSAEHENEDDDIEWVGRIRRALEHNDFVLFAQPVLDLRTNEFTRSEILLRMRGDEGTKELIAPGDFLEVAEGTNLIGDIDRWVLREVMPLLRAEQQLSVNLSARSIGDLTLTSAIEAMLGERKIERGKLTVEIPESAAVGDLQAARLFSERLHSTGCNLALDDFGTGYGSFTYLKHLSIECLKIDMQFIRDLVHSDSDRRVVRSIARIAEDFGIDTVAEGVENEETLELLREYGVHYAQGYHLGHPAPAPELRSSVAPPGG
jgi:PAS domain S-box-containing protein